jgi:cobalt-zinc-cadmium efflux system membrane fusion protein
MTASRFAALVSVAAATAIAVVGPVSTGTSAGAAQEQTGETVHAEDRRGTEGSHEAEEDHGNEIVTLSSEEMQEFGVETAAARAGTLETYITLPGEVVANQDNVAHVVPRYPGMVLEVRKKVGDPVRKGEVLAVIESNESLVPYEVKSLIAGTVIEKHITLGEVLDQNTDAYVIADLSTVWVNLSVYQEYLPVLRERLPVTIVNGHDLNPVEATISYYAPIVDEHTRTGLARVVLGNPGHRWRPGQFVTGRIRSGRHEAAVVVPRTALQTYEGGDCVFVLTDVGFAPRTISIGRENGERVEVVSGLETGERYVVRGGFTLKAELLKGSFSGGHQH